MLRAYWLIDYIILLFLYIISMAVGLYLAALLLLAQVSACPTNSVLPGIEVGTYCP